MHATRADQVPNPIAPNRHEGYETGELRGLLQKLLYYDPLLITVNEAPHNHRPHPRNRSYGATTAEVVGIDLQVPVAARPPVDRVAAEIHMYLVPYLRQTPLPMDILPISERSSVKVSLLGGRFRRRDSHPRVGCMDDAHHASPQNLFPPDPAGESERDCNSRSSCVRIPDACRKCATWAHPRPARTPKVSSFETSGATFLAL